jgi:ribosomal protein S18 acetylase RimI-like enzyme
MTRGTAHGISHTCRGQGIGEALVRHLCGGSADAVFLTTIGRRRAFYERAGFRELPFAQVPK